MSIVVDMLLVGAAFGPQVYREVMSTYEGPATAILSDGQAVSVVAYLKKTNTGLESWGGSIKPEDDADQYAFLPDTITLPSPSRPMLVGDPVGVDEASGEQV